ncbi:hypothetical protein COB11_08145 [Candidatus Aerophobetes bacterium]|uniref:Uncharacterized protein n=1 Tax=Aerophobetes bacterium TaxID=2030807 RepID=A0A2A4YAT7_UNCAE|nr:MAG: hypothetical protein COB11_08145 [Candidatus Aerophobetes bacterium]
MDSHIELPRYSGAATDSLVHRSKELRDTLDSTCYLTKISHARIEKLANGLLGQVTFAKKQALKDGTVSGSMRLAESKVLDNIKAVELRLKFLHPKRMAKTKKEFQKKKESFLTGGQRRIKKGISRFFKKDASKSKGPSSFFQLLTKEAYRFQRQNHRVGSMQDLHP